MPASVGRIQIRFYAVKVTTQQTKSNTVYIVHKTPYTAGALLALALSASAAAASAAAFCFCAAP